MNEMKTIVEHIQEELEDAITYAKLAIAYKGTDPEISGTFSALAGQELNHADLLHEQVFRLIKGNGAPPALQTVWEWEHDQYVEKVAKIKAMLEMAKK